MVGALNWLADTAASVGLATSPLTCASSALVGITVNELADLSIGIVGNTPVPEEANAETFTDAVRPSAQNITGLALYDNEDIRSVLVANSDPPAGPATISYENFLGIADVGWPVAQNGEEASQQAMLQVLISDYFP